MKMTPNRTRVPFAVATLKLLPRLAKLGLLALAAGCGSGGGSSAIGISPNTPQILDAGETLALTVAVVNDANGSGAKIVLTGAGSLGTPATTRLGSSDSVAITYTAPATVTASATATVTATANNTPSQTASLGITVNPALTLSPATLPAGTVASPYTATVTASGGTGTSTLAVTTGALPAGLKLNSATGAITGTPTAYGSFSLTITATDQATTPQTISQAYTLVINPQPPTVTTTSLPNGLSGQAYSQQLAYAYGGGGAVSWAISNGSLPAGLTLSASGLISGTPTNAAAGTTSAFAVTVTVGTQTSAGAALSITIPALPAVATLTLPSGNIGVAYKQQLQATGGNGSTPAWAIVAGSLPSSSGLTLSSSGLLSGTPTSGATYSFSVAVTIGPQTSVPQAYTLTVFSINISSGSSATGEVGLPFYFSLTAVGGTRPYTWALASGSAALPAGLALNPATGVISGTPATSTGSPFSGVVVQATDSATPAGTATQAMTFTINPARTNANNSLLKGTYAFQLSGFDANGYPTVTAGNFTADGAGNITGGSLDLNGTGMATPLTNAALLASTYSVGTDNRGKVTLATNGTSATFTLALDTVTAGVAAGGYLNEFDGTGQTRTGSLALATPAAFNTASLTGGFAFGLEGFQGGTSPGSGTNPVSTHRATIGEIQFGTVSTGTAVSAELITSASSTPAPTVPTSATLAVASTGRGTLAIVFPSGGGTSNFAVYVVSPTKFFLVGIDPAGASTAGTRDLLGGQALAQTATSFNAASLNATSVYRLDREALATTGSFYPDAQVGLYTFNGAGKLTLAADENAGGVASSLGGTGTYTIAGNGRVSAFLTTASGLGGCTDCVSLQTFFYLVGPNQGFAMDFSSGVNFGDFEPQTAAPMTTNGAYAFGTLGPVVAAGTDQSGVLTLGTSFTSTSDQNSAGTLAPDQTSTSTISVLNTNGRAVITPVGGSLLVLYFISINKAIELDTSAAKPVIVEVVHQ